MQLPPNLTQIVDGTTEHRDRLPALREILLANTVMFGEFPAATGEEDLVAKFLADRFTEDDLDSVSIDEAGNAAGVVKGHGGSEAETAARPKILVAAHMDKIWPKTDDHTVSVSADALTGRGIGDNALGVAVLASLPAILQSLEIELSSDLLLVGTSQSFGHGDLKGMRFFLDNMHSAIGCGLCLEGTQIGRLSYSSLGMLRAEVKIEAAESEDWVVPGGSSAIRAIHRIIEKILSIERPESPRTSIILGSVDTGNDSFNVPPQEATLRFEVRSESAEIVNRIQTEIEEIVEECAALREVSAQLEVVATRVPGDIGFSHPLVKCAREVMESLDINPRTAPSISELSALLDKNIPSLTLGLTKGDSRNTSHERIEIEPLFAGVAQIISVIQSMDAILTQSPQASLS